MIAPAPLRGVRAAFVFLTRVPVGGFPYTDDEWRWAAAHFPLVGALLGTVVGAVDYVLLPLGELAAALGAIGVSLFLTGALHEDGLADTSDALGGAFARDKILAILKDSRVGTFGACALVLSIVGRAALLARLGPGAPWAFVLAGAAARGGARLADRDDALRLVRAIEEPGSDGRQVRPSGDRRCVDSDRLAHDRQDHGGLPKTPFGRPRGGR